MSDDPQTLASLAQLHTDMACLLLCGQELYRVACAVVLLLVGMLVVLSLSPVRGSK